MTAASAGQMCSCSQVMSGMSSASPRISVIGLCVCALTNPGISTCCGRSTYWRDEYFARASACGKTSTTEPPFTATAWSSSTTPCGSTGISQRARSRRSMGCGMNALTAGKDWLPAFAGMIDSRRNPPRGSSANQSLHPADVFARAGIHLDHFVLLDEQRHTHHRAGFQLGRFAATAGRVAAHARIGFDDFQFDEVGRRHRQRRTVPQRDDALLLAFQPLRSVAHRVLVCGVLLVGIRLHEVPELAVVVEILHVGVDYVGTLHGIRGLQRLLGGRRVIKIEELDAGEGLALAGLDE